MDNLRMFLPITKVDATQRLVYGVATGETVDRSGEICDYTSTKPFYEKWSGAISKATEGKSLGNLRAMHGKVAAGKVTSIAFNDDAKQIEIAAKVVDDAEWRKVEEGVYTGFSQGGGYVKRWKDDAGLQRYTADPSEISLVDLPCLDTATFQMIKSADSVETRHFAESVQVKAEPTVSQVAEKATELAKAAGKDADWASFIDPAREALKKAALPAPPEMTPKKDDDGGNGGAPATPPAPGDGVEQVWRAKDGSTYAKKADAIAKNAEIDAAPNTKKVLDALDDLGVRLGIEKGAKPPVEELVVAPPTIEDAIAKRSRRTARERPDADMLAKDLYAAGRFAQMLAELRGFAASAEYQSFFEGDSDDGFAKTLKGWVSQGCSLLVAMVQDEADQMGEPDEAMAMAAGGKLKPTHFAALDKAAKDVPSIGKLLDVMEKAGARNSKADSEKIQAMHDHACDLGATCKDGGADKAVGNADLTKALAALSEASAGRDAEKARGDALQKTLDDRILPMLGKLQDRVEEIAKQPQTLPFHGLNLRAVNKGGEDSATAEAELERMQKEDPDGFRLLLHKVSQSQPQKMIPR